MIKFPFYRQLDYMDCGPTCLKMIAKYHGKTYSLPFLREKCYIDRAGVSLAGMSEGAELIGLRTLAVKVPLISSGEEPSLSDAPLPRVGQWNQNHFIVVYKITRKYVYVADPGAGKFKLSHRDFKKSFCSNGEQGIALLLETTPEFYNLSLNEDVKKGFGFLFQYLKPHYKLLFQLTIGLLLGTLFQLIFPFLTQSLVDIGILLHISVRINVGLIADFLIKMMKLPLGFFDSKNTGDLLQRISDHKRIEDFLTRSTLSIMLSCMNLLVFGVVLAIYSIPIFMTFFIAAILYVLWILIFLRKRKEVDYKAFQELSNNQDSLIEIIQGIPEIKLQGSQQKRRWRWAMVPCSPSNTSSGNSTDPFNNW